MPYVSKSENAVVTYTFNYQTNLLDEDQSPSETIVSSAWDIEPDEGSPGDLLIDASANDHVSTSVRIRGGTIDHVYRVRNRIVTSYGNTFEKVLVVIIGQD